MKLIIFISKEDDFYGSAKRIQDISKIDSEIVFIENFVNQKGWQNINTTDIIYFLCNGYKVNYVLNEIIKTTPNCKIINKEYLIKNEPKSNVQKKINELGVITPRVLSIKDIDNIKFPIFCKQNIHTGIVFKAYTKKTITDFFEKFDLNDFYLEEAVSSDLKKYKEFKVYYANAHVYPKDNEPMFNDEIKNICLIISEALYNLEAFSVDFIANDDGLYVIDVNVASGFYMSTDARKEFVKNYVNKYVNKER